jgi:hypothetical protein
MGAKQTPLEHARYARAKEITAGIQRVLTDVQVAERQADQRACPGCRNPRSLKGHHPIVFRTPFGKLRFASERVRVCPCTQSPTVSVSPLADLLSKRVSPEMLYLETKFVSLVSYGLTVRLMDEVLPFDRPIGAERVRRHLFLFCLPRAIERANSRRPVDSPDGAPSPRSLIFALPVALVHVWTAPRMQEKK